MKKLYSKIIAIFLAVILLLTTALPVYAKSFSTNSLLTTDVGPTDWMSGIDDSTYLSDISIPGTHDSGTKSVDFPIWSKTQTLSISEQLNIGIRYFDLRLEHVSDVYYNAQIVHSTSKCWNDGGGHLTLYEVLNDMYAFLDKNPSETVIVSVKQDAGDDINALANDVNTLIDLNSKYWFTGYYTPQLGSVRGKCVLATRISEVGRGISLSWGDQGSDGGAVDSGWMKVQDRYKMGTSSKWANAAKPMLDEKKPDGVWYVNFMSTTGGGIAGVESNASSMNGYFRTYEMMNNKCYGIICLDYATEDLVTKIYKANDLVAKQQPNSEAGQYYYRLNLNTWDDIPSGWQSVSCRLYYKENNGTGQEKSVLLFDQTDTYKGYAFVAAVTNNDFTGYVNGFPTYVEMSFNWTSNDGIGINQRLYVGKGPDDNLTLVGKHDVRYTTSTNSNDAFAVNSDAYPQIKSVAFADTSDLYASVPSVDSNDVNQYAVDFSIYDQYGIKWQSNSATLKTDVNYSGVSFSDNKIMIDKNANDVAPDTSFNIYAVYNNGSSVIRSAPRRVYLSTNKIPYTFVNYNGEVLQTGSEYAGTVPQYTGETPTREPDENGHYTFSSWTPSTAVSVDSNIYTAFFTCNNHIVSRTSVQVEPTCTSSGISTNYCTCGYSWESITPALGHNFVTVQKNPTCTEDGYKKEICRIDSYVKSETVLPATGHDTENAIRGDYVEAKNDENGYIPYYCSVCGEEILSMRKYDTVNWNSYYDALGVVDGIKADPDYHTYDNAYILQFESAITTARSIENDETHLQLNIDNATNDINVAIAEFSRNIGVNYYMLTFVFDSGVNRKLTYKEGTLAKNIAVPTNTASVMTDTQHKIYRWETVKDVTQNKTYVESNVTRAHTYNTYIAPDIVHTAVCTEDASVEHRCICGYTYTEITGKGTIHSWGEWTSNGNGTHSRVCLNDSSHTETDTCVVNLDNHKCVICDYVIDTSSYYANLQRAENELNNTKKYSQEGLDGLQISIDKAKSDFAVADTQAKVDAVVSDLFNAIFTLMMYVNHFDIKFTYVIDDETVVTSSFNNKVYETSLTFSIPQSVLDKASVEKWTAYYNDEDKLKRFANSVNSVIYTVEDNIEFVAYLSTDKEQSVAQHKVCLTDITGKVIQVIYLDEGEYSLSVGEKNVTLTKDNKSYELTAKDAVFYNVSGFALDDKELPDTVNIADDIIINTRYSAK